MEPANCTRGRIEANSYDELPYAGVAVSRSHPAMLATLGTIFGMSPADVECARVLELGCAEGGNLVPMAVDLPRSEFLGVDASQRQIAVGCESIRRLGLNNIRLEQWDILDLDASIGVFDYIIAHGILSWVAEPVRAKIFDICRRHLNPMGIAFISYNTYPGGHLRRMVREIMLYSARISGTAEECVARSRALLDFLVEHVPQEHGAYRAVLQWEQERIGSQSNAHVRHDLLEDVHEAFYFSDVAARASQARLQYLADASLETMFPRNFTPPAFDELKRTSGTLVEMEQYMDFLTNRTFRETLFCSAAIPLERKITADRLNKTAVATSMTCESTVPSLAGDRPETFQHPRGGSLTTKIPLVKAAMIVLAEIWPQSTSIDELLAAARSRLACSEPDYPQRHSEENDRVVLSEALLDCFTKGLVTASIRPARCTTTVSDRPKATGWARLQAEQGCAVTNQWHRTVQVGALPRLLLRHLDGNVDRIELQRILIDLAGAGRIRIEDRGAAIVQRPQLTRILAEQVDLGLAELARAGLLVA